MRAWLERRFGIEAAGSSVRRELLAGGSTFLAMSYIVLVNPSVLATAGMDPGAVMVATCVASAIASLWMGLHANYPIGLAPGMGHNFFFALTVCGPVAAGGYGYSWQAALAAVLVSGLVFVVASFWGLRALLVTVVPGHLRTAIAVGIGLLIAVVGLRWGGVLAPVPGLFVGLGELGATPTLVFLFGLGLTSVLVVARFRAALLVGILATAAVAAAAGLAEPRGLVAWPPSLAPTFLAFDLRGLLAHPDFWSVIVVLFMVDLFDTVGTLVGVGERAGLLVGGELPRARQAFLADAVGTVVGAVLGTSTVTSYVESAAGVAAGGRTGFAAVVTGLLFLGALFFYPLVALVGGGVEIAPGRTLYPVLAPALVLVGVYMMQGVGRIDWAEPLEAIPAFLTMTMMPLTTSITEGIAFGFIATSFLAAASGRPRRVHAGVHVIAAAFFLRYALL